MIPALYFLISDIRGCFTIQKVNQDSIFPSFGFSHPGSARKSITVFGHSVLSLRHSQVPGQYRVNDMDCLTKMFWINCLTCIDGRESAQMELVELDAFPFHVLSTVL